MLINSTENIVSEDEGDEGNWLVTYADMMTLLLVFFVLLFSISVMDLKKFKDALQSIQVGLGSDKPPVALLKVIEEDAAPKQIVLENVIGLKSRKDRLLDEMSEFLYEHRSNENVRLDIEDGKIKLRITGHALFDSGSAELNAEAAPILAEITRIIKRYPDFKINIKGFTDNIPISTPRYPSNWELSAIRATSVLKFLVNRGVDENRLTATGYGELNPLVPNTSEANRAKNRRVEFVLEEETD
ncbi:MAG: flagellar motor protein MotB [Thermodesulfobacteriota bacterium]|nr:flagellar motor protein MotB [Thermodesulfobacteriota bacterium]